MRELHQSTVEVDTKIRADTEFCIGDVPTRPEVGYIHTVLRGHERRSPAGGVPADRSLEAVVQDIVEETKPESSRRGVRRSERSV
jgi:hypothetical protein